MESPEPLSEGLLDALPDAALLIDPAGRIVRASARAAALLGRAAGELARQPLESLLAEPADAPRLRAVLAALDGGDPSVPGPRCELALRGRSGPFPAELSLGRAGPEGGALAIVRGLGAFRRAVEALRSSEERLRQAARVTGTGIFDHDHRSDVIYWSPEQRANYGWDPGEPVSLEKFIAQVHPDDRERIWRAVQRAHDPSGDGLYDVEHRILRRDGQVRWLVTRSRTLFEGEGPARHKVRTVGAVVDVTARRLQAEEQRLKDQAIATAGIGIAIADARACIVYANPAVVKLWGYASEQEMLGRPVLDFTSGPLHGRALELLRTTGRFEGEVVCVRKDGSRFDALLSASTFTDESGRLSHMMSSFLDISERKRAEEAREQLAAVLDATPDYVGVADAEGRRQYLNRAARKLLGIAPDADIALTGMLDSHPEWTRRLLREEALPAAQRDGVWEGETAFLDPEGREIPFSQVVLAHKRPDGAVDRYSTIARDLREQKSLQAQLLQSQKLEAIGRLAGGVAHDFNNLLTVINCNCDLILDAPSLDAEARRNVEMVREAGQSAASLTRQLLAFSRKQVMQPVSLDLNALVAKLERMLRRVIGEHIELATRLGEGLWPVRADAGQLEQVILNLTVNARDAMPRGGKLLIETGNVLLDEEYARQHRGARTGEHVLLAVSDSGHGMDADTLSRIFEPFFSTKGQLGTGLGLSTVLGIVQQSGGHLWPNSEPGRGTTFKIYLPRDTAAQLQPAPAPEAGPRAGPGGTVLVVEDAAGVRGLVMRVLERLGYRVLSASSAAEAAALAAAWAGPIDLLLTDVVMPGGGGRELADRLAAERPGLKIVFMSGYTENAIVHQGVLDPGIEFLSKPFTLDELERKVAAVLGGGGRPAG